jgi:hypothetical protein
MIIKIIMDDIAHEFTAPDWATGLKLSAIRSPKEEYLLVIPITQSDIKIGERNK